MRQNHGGDHAAVLPVLHPQLRRIAVKPGETGARIGDADSPGRTAIGRVETGAIVAYADFEFAILQGGADADGTL